MPVGWMWTAVVGVIAVAVAACGSPPTAPSGGQQDVAGRLLIADVARAEPQSADVEALVEGVTRFGIELLTEVAAPDENVVLSPASIGLAFGMARAGAAGDTAAEIDEVLGLPREAAVTHASFNAVDRLLADAAPSALDAPDPQATRPADEDKPPALEIANGVFPQIGFPIHDDFLATLAREYGAGVIPLDFGDPEGAKELIDEWVRERTRDRIEKLFDQLDPRTKLVLANAIYLKADWLRPFASEPVRDLPFTLASGEQVDVPTMGQLETFRYARGDGWQAVELPYVGERLAMWVLVPDRGRTPLEVLTPETLATIGDSLDEGFVDVRLPRWDFDTDVELVPALQALGMHAPFDPSAADFSGITDAGLWIGDAIHRATITVDEWGTEAAAVTGLGFATSGPPPSDAVIHADRPFAFTIVDTQAHTPLFLGQVADPRPSNP